MKREPVPYDVLHAFAQKCQDIQCGVIEGATEEQAKGALWDYVMNWPHTKDGFVSYKKDHVEGPR